MTQVGAADVAHALPVLRRGTAMTIAVALTSDLALRGIPRTAIHEHINPLSWSRPGPLEPGSLPDIAQTMPAPDFLRSAAAAWEAVMVADRIEDAS